MRQYGTDFKEKVLKLSDETGVKKAALKLGDVYETLPDWPKIRGK